MNDNIKPILIGNAYELDTHGGFGMDVFHQDGICRTLNATWGGGAAQTLVMIEEPMCLGYSRDSKPDREGQYHTRRHLQEVVNALCVSRRETNEILIIEPHKTMEQAEPQVKSIGNRNPSGHGIGGEVYDTQGLAPTLCVNKGSGYTVAEPQSCAIRTRAYTGQPAAIEMGDEVANALTSVQKDSMVTEPLRVRQATEKGYIECPVGGGFDAAYPNSKLRRGRVQDNGNVVGAITSSTDGHCVYEGQQEQQPKIMQHTPLYRIRKLTPRECYRLMDVEDQYIDLLLTPTDEKGKPIIPKSQHYKLAGNSIVVSCLYNLFHNLFIDNNPTQPIQLTLF